MQDVIEDIYPTKHQLFSFVIRHLLNKTLQFSKLNEQSIQIIYAVIFQSEAGKLPMNTITAILGSKLIDSLPAVHSITGSNMTNLVGSKTALN